MTELSSNWKKLQAKLKAESTSQPRPKRKADTQSQLSPKRQRLRKETADNAGSKKAIRHRNSQQMGGVQSSIQKHDSQDGPSPSIALWAENNDISAESVAEAYGLGLNGSSISLTSDKDKINHGLTEGLDVGKFVAIDCEMVGVGPGGYESVLARMSLVDYFGRQIYDSYVKPQEFVTDWRTSVSGISPKEMRFARDFEEVQLQAHQLLEGRVLIGHDVKHDLEALKLSHPFRDIRDTAKHADFRKFGNGRKPALRILAQEVLGVEIQKGPHSSIEDARVTMLLFRKHQSAFNTIHANRFATRPVPVKGPPQQGKGGKKKRGR